MNQTEAPDDLRTSMLRSLAQQQREGRSALDWLQGVLWRVPGRPVDVHKLWLLRFEGVPCPSDRLIRGAATVRAGVQSDVEGMSRCEGKPIETFLRRFKDRDFCIVAEMDGEIVGYAWFSVALVYSDSYFGFQCAIPNDAVFGYDGFVLPEHRLTGAWLKFQRFLGCQMKLLGKNAVLTAIEHSNRLSLATHLRFGFEPYASVLVLRVLGRTFSIESPVQR